MHSSSPSGRSDGIWGETSRPFRPWIHFFIAKISREDMRYNRTLLLEFIHHSLVRLRTSYIILLRISFFYKKELWWIIIKRSFPAII